MNGDAVDEVAREGGDRDPAAAADRLRETAAPVALIAVGATMVGSVRLSFDDLTTNVAGRRPERRDLEPDAAVFERGEEWGHFEFGSTIVMLTPERIGQIDPRPVGEALRLGQVVGRIGDRFN